MDGIIVNEFRNWAGTVDHKCILPNRYPCLNLWEHPSINWNGDVMLCCQTFGFLRDGVIGNVEESSLQEIWTKNKRLHKIRLGHLQGDYTGASVCVNCTSWKNYPNIFNSIVKKILYNYSRSKLRD